MNLKVFIIIPALFYSCFIYGLPDMGFRDSEENRSKVLYEEDGNIILKTCLPTVIHPHRNCKTDFPPLSMGKRTYTNKLGLETGNYNISKEHLEFAKFDLEAARIESSSGNRTTQLAAERIERNITEIRRGLALMEKLKEGVYQIRHEFNKEYMTYLDPFNLASFKFKSRNSNRKYLVLKGLFTHSGAIKTCAEFNGFRLATFMELDDVAEVLRRNASRFNFEWIRSLYDENYDGVKTANYVNLWSLDSSKDSSICKPEGINPCPIQLRMTWYKKNRGRVCGDNKTVYKGLYCLDGARWSTSSGNAVCVNDK